MTRPRLNRHVLIAGFFLAVGALAAGVWLTGYRRALDQLAARAEADLALASDRLTAQLQRYQEVAVLTADHPALERLDGPEARAAAAALLLEVADKTAALDVMYADRTGTVLVAAQEAEGRDLSGNWYLQRALQGALGSDHGLNPPLDRRAYYYAAPAFALDGRVRGALVVAVDIELVEEAWRGATPAVFFTDTGGEVFVTNRSELLFRRLPPAPGAEVIRAQTVGSHEIWRLDWGPYLPTRALHLVQPLPVIGLTGEVLVDAGPARALAGLQAAAVAAICLAFGAMLFVATERRRTLAEANAVLESRVDQRTRALSATNVQLRREVAERKEAEAALKRAQDDLVQAGKLSALGQMSAGISHELNQPLMAIQQFAENGQKFLDQDKADKADENLGRIGDMARRMGRIIRNLRAFARQESEAAAQVDIAAVIASAVELSAARLAHEGVTLDWTPPDAPVWVRGGEVRLGQVFINLINNAADAMAGQAEKSISIALRPATGGVLVEVADTGPGLDDPEKIFDPFYTTKAVGESEGMGLGLSISYGLVQSFGGEIRGRNRDGGGAVFTVALPYWDIEAAA